MAAQVSPPIPPRPGTDATNPHQDLYIPPSRLGRSLAPNPRRPASETPNASATRSSYTSSTTSTQTQSQPQFGSVDFWTRREQSDVERSAPLQAASIHRAAEVARWEWTQIHRSSLDRERSTHPREQHEGHRSGQARYSILSSSSTSAEALHPSAPPIPWRQGPLQESVSVTSVSSPYSTSSSTTSTSSSSSPSSDTTAIGRAVNRLHDVQAHIAGQSSSLRPWEDDSFISAYSRPTASNTTIMPRSTTQIASTSAPSTEPQSPRPSSNRSTLTRVTNTTRLTASAGSFHDDLTAWNNLCRDLAIAAGVSPDEGEAHDDTLGGGSATSISSRGILPFGIDAGPRGLPHPIWGRRYLGPAGIWLRAELLTRGRDIASSTRGAEGVTPASALANEWRATVANSGRPIRGNVFRSPAAALLPSEPTTAPHVLNVEPQTADIPRLTISDENPTAALRPASTLGLPVPALAGNLTDPWATSRMRNDENAPPPQIGSSDSQMSSTSIAVALGREARSIQRSQPIRPQMPATQRQREGNDPLPDTAFEVPPAASSQPQRSAAAEEVARLARASRSMRDNRRRARQARSAVAEDISEGSETRQSRPSTDAESGATTRSQRVSDGSGMRMLRRLRALDGLEEEEVMVASQSVRERVQDNDEHEGDGGVPTEHVPAAHELFPWYSPRFDEFQEESSSTASLRSWRQDTLVLQSEHDPDGDGIGQDWYRGVRARMQTSQAESAALTALGDPDGERVNLEDSFDSRYEGRDGEGSAQRTGRRARGVSEAEEGSTARRQRNRTALVIAEREEGPPQGPSPWLSPTSAAASRPLTEGWTLINPTTSRSPVVPPQSLVRLPQDEGSENVTTWFRGPAHIPTLSTSPGPIQAIPEPPREASLRSLSPAIATDATTHVQSSAPDPRTVRRPQRLRSLNEDDLAGAGARLSEAEDEVLMDVQSQTRPRSNAPQPIPTWSSPARRAQFWRSGQPMAEMSDYNGEFASRPLSSAPGMSIFESHRNMPIDELRARASFLWRASQQLHSRAADVAERLRHGVGDAETQPTSDPRESPTQSGPETSLRSLPVNARMSFSTANHFDRMADTSRSLEAELREREADLRASSARLAEELSRRRARIDELRQREGRIGRVLESSEAALGRMQERASSSATNNGLASHNVEVAGQRPSATADGGANSIAQLPSAVSPDATSPPPSSSSSLVRRRTLRDPAPQFRGPRAPRGGFNYLEHSSDPAGLFTSPRQSVTPTSLPLRRSFSSSSLGRPTSSDGIAKENEQTSSNTASSRTTSPRRSLDDSVLVSPHTSEGVLMNHSPLRSLVTLEDQARLGKTSTLILEAIDAMGHASYRKAVLESHRQRLETWAPVQAPTPSSTMEAAFPLRFDISRHVRSRGASDVRQGLNKGGTSTSTARLRNVLLNDESCVRFDADQGTELVMRFLAAVPISSAMTDSARNIPMPHAEDDGAPTATTPRTSTSRTDAEGTWTAAGERQSAIRNGAAIASLGQGVSGTLRAGELDFTASGPTSLHTSDHGVNSGRLSSSPPSSNEPPSVLRELSDRETSVIRHMLALRNEAPTVAERVAQLSNLSHDDVDVIRGLARRAYPPGAGLNLRLNAGNALTTSGSSSAEQQQQPSSSSGSSVSTPSDLSRPTAGATASSWPMNLALPQSLSGRTPVPVLLPTEAVALTQEQARMIEGFHATAFPDLGAAPTSSAQILSLIEKEKVDRFIALRAQSISQAVATAASSEGPDRLGPVFALSSLVIKIREATDPARDYHSQRSSITTSGSDVHAGGGASHSARLGSSSRMPSKIVHALIFFSVEPIRREQLAYWDGKSKTDIMCYLRTLKRERYARLADEDGASSLNGRLEHWEIDATREAAEEEGDLGDPFAVARRREEMKKADEEGMQRLMLAGASSEGQTEQGTPSSTATASSSDLDLPPLRPAAVVPIDLHRGGAIVNLEHEGLRTYGNTRQRRQRPVGRYLAIKILAGDGEGVRAAEASSSRGQGQVGQDEASGVVAASSRRIDLFYIGVKGWPAAGTGSLDGRWHD